MGAHICKQMVQQGVTLVLLQGIHNHTQLERTKQQQGKRDNTLNYRDMVFIV